MRINFSYTKYKDSPTATFYSYIVNAITAIVSYVGFFSALILLIGIYDGIANGNWDGYWGYVIAAIVICGIWHVLRAKVIIPAIDKVAQEDREQF